MNKVKQWLKSKTIWFNAVFVPMLTQALFYAEANITLIQENLGAAYGITTFSIGLINMYLRSITTEALSDK